MTPLQLLDNIAWHSLTGPQAACSVGTGQVRRYARGFSPIVAFADPERPDLAALEPHCDADEHLYCSGWSGRGLARRLMLLLLRRELHRGEMPFLHVLRDNRTVHDLHARMGFHDHRELTVRVLSSPT